MAGITTGVRWLAVIVGAVARIDFGYLITAAVVMFIAQAVLQAAPSEFE